VAGLWDEEGCRVEYSDQTHTLCLCNHLSTFAVLMDLPDYVVSKNILLSVSILMPFPGLQDCSIYETIGKDSTLELLSWTCTGASVLCLLLTLIIFQVCRSIQSERTRIGKNICACLVAAHVLALFFLDRSYVNFSEVGFFTLHLFFTVVDFYN
ncbi:hypothetical protein L9F63_018167, partial [Diploptera punctata]